MLWPLVPLDVEPTGRIPYVGTNFFQLSSRLVVGPKGEVGVDVDLVLEIAELILLSVPAAMYYRVADHRQIRWRADGLANGQQQWELCGCCSRKFRR